MTLAELRYLIALKQEQHFGRAAARCGVSQPALSNAVRKLEMELDVVLFERSRSAVKPTSVGAQVVTQAEKVLASTAIIQDLAKADQDHLTGLLRVGAISTLAPYLLPRCVLHLKKNNSPLQLHTDEGYAAALGEQLRQGLLDVLVVSLPFAATDVVTQVLFEEPFAVILPRHHPLARQFHLQSQDLEGQHVLLPGPDDCLHQQILDLCPYLKSETGHYRSHSSGPGALETLRSLVASGLGIALLPLSVVTVLCSGQTDLVWRPFNEAAPGRTIALAWRTSFPRHKAIDVLREAILSCKPTENYYTTDPEPEERGLMVNNSFW